MNEKTDVRMTRKRVSFRIFAAATLIFAFLLVFVAPAAALERDESWGTDYSTNNEFTIYDIGDLAQFAYLVNNDKMYFDGKTVTLNKDINLENQKWTSISGFKGIFNGNNKNITGLDTSLFGGIANGAVIKDLHVFCDINSNSNNVGGIVSYVNGKITISGCSVSGTVTGAGGNGGTGGIIGSGSGDISGCSVSGTIMGADDTGGIVGRSEKITISGCSVSGTVTGKGDTGGIIGFCIPYDETNSNIKISDCSVSGTITGTSRYSTTGGIVGWGLVDISGCSVLGTVTGESNTGGIMGGQHSQDKVSKTISNCYIGADVTSTGKNSNAGGIVGLTFFSIEAGDIGTRPDHIIENCMVTGDVSGSSDTGGICGASNFGAKISNCIVTGNVTNTMKSTYSNYAGGISGGGSEVEISYCYALSQEIIGKHAYRIGDVKTISYSYAWVGTEINGDLAASGRYNNKNGSDKYAIEIWKKLSSNSLDNKYWTHDYTKYPFPYLKNHPVPSEDTVAHLEPKYTLNYDKNGQGITAPKPSYSKYAGGEPEVIKGITKENTGYTLVWTENKNGSEPFYKEGDKLRIWKDTTLYAKWKLNKYTITWKNDDNNVLRTDTVSHGSVPSYGDSPEKTATEKYTYTFAGWTPYVVNAVSDAEYTATYTENINCYLAEFNPNGGTWDDETTAKKTILVEYEADIPNWNNLTKQGYNFGGWNPAIGKMDSTNGKSFSAIWNPSDATTYNVTTHTMNVDGKTYAEAMQTFSNTTDSTVTAEYDISEGFILNTEKSTLSGTVKADNSLHLHVYKDRKTYTLTFDTAGGTEIPVLSLIYGADVPKQDEPSRAGYTFTGWNPAIPSTMPAKDITVTAQWEKIIYPSSSSGGYIQPTIPVTPPDEPEIPDSGDDGEEIYTIIFNANGGEGIMEPQNVTKGETVTLKVNTFTKSGYTFAGWTLIEGTAIDFANEAEFTPESNVTLYAVWKEIEVVHTGFPLWLLLLICGLLVTAIIGSIYLRKRK